MKLAIALVALLSICAPAEAHDFYSLHCCSGRDCSRAADGDVMWTPAGYAVKSTNEIVAPSDPRIQYSPPGEPGYRICIIPGQPTLRCLYVPEPEW